ncbi:MAG: Wzz/FepE/Etk N-terminal domain-containing protein, partial [Bacteroidota bacterium]
MEPRIAERSSERLRTDLALADRHEDDAAVELGWELLGILYDRRWFIAGVCVLIGIAAVVLTLLMPNQYRAETRVLQPEGGDLGIGGLLQSVAPGAASLLGGESGSFTRYLAILDARTMMEAAVEEFDLEAVYDLDPGDPEALSSAIKELRARTEFVVVFKAHYKFGPG